MCISCFKNIDLNLKGMKKISIIVIMVLFLCGSTTVEEQRRKQFIQSNATLNEDMKLHISEGKIQLGMTEEQVIASWGEPIYRHEEHDLNFHNIGEEWRYGEYFVSNSQDYLYFEEGKLIDITKTSMIANKRREQYIKQHPELNAHIKSWIAHGLFRHDRGTSSSLCGVSFRKE